MATRVGPDEYRCPGCGGKKHRDEFYDSKCKRNGISHYCKHCHREKQRKNRARQPAALR